MAYNAIHVDMAQNAIILDGERMVSLARYAQNKRRRRGSTRPTVPKASEIACETEVGSLQINDMRAETPIATGTWYHVMSLDITQCHDLTVPKLAQRPLF